MATEVAVTRFQSDVDQTGFVERVSLEAGIGWNVATQPETMLALVKTTRPGLFEPNVAVLVTEHSPEFDAREIINDLDPQRLDIPDLVAQEPFEVTVDGVDFVGRAIAFRD